MGRPIRFGAANSWGTCFCIRRADKLRFITAAHVLICAGCARGSASFKTFLCDEKTHTEEAVEYELTGVKWDYACDYAEFDCGFPGQPYTHNSGLAYDGIIANIEGYLRGDDGKMPPCDSPTSVEGIILSVKECSPGRNSVSVVIPDRTTAPGLSGSPATADTGEVMFVFARGTGTDQRFGGATVSP